ncbi:little elongation complex subunit 1 [Conger conger]|uniref:little elongation complex subunit 1 n=1 Tax=Conger conger TaxID=82655 RepID=UPI002A5A83B4|nr:little elongation complex subunit 1 [Conger conger]
MMPGESHKKSSGLTSGVCQNCTVLHQNLKEYVAALLILERKIIDTDHLLTEYQEKCDELQKSQRETSKLHHELDELLLKMVPLEKQNEECEAMRAELEEKNNSLKKFQQTSEELDRLKEESTKLLTSKKNLENQLKTFEDCSIKKDCEIIQLKKEKNKLEESLHTTRKNLEELEIKCQRDLRNVATETNFPEEPKIDKTKVKQLLEELWMCIEPPSLQATSQLHFTGIPCESSDYCNDHLKPCSVLVQGAEATNTRKSQKRNRASGEFLYSDTFTEKKTSPRKKIEKKTPPPKGNHEEDIDEILDCFKPLPPLLSPVIFTSPEEALFGDVSDSSDDEKFDDVCQGIELSTMETTDMSMLLAPADNGVLDFSTPCDTLAKLCENSMDEEMHVSQSEIQICELKKEKIERADESVVYTSDDAVMDGLSGSSSKSFVLTVSSIVSTEQSIPEHTGSVRNKCSDAEDMGVEETPHKKKEMYAEVNCEKAFPILQNKHTGNHQVSCATPDSESILGPQLSPLRVNSDYFGHSKDVDVHSDTPTCFGNFIPGSLSNSFTQSQECNETEYQNPPCTSTNDDTKSEQSVVKTRSEVNPTDVPGESFCFPLDNSQINANVLDLAGQSPGYFAVQSVSCIVSTEQSIPEHTGSVRNKCSDAEDMGVEENTQKEKELFAEVNCEKVLPILQNEHTGNNKVSATPDSESILGPQLSPHRVKSDDFAQDVDVHSVTNDDAKSEQTVSKALPEVNTSDDPEESICFSEDNHRFNANLLDLAESTSPHCPNDGIGRPKDTSASDSEICTGPEVSLTPPSELVTTSELPDSADWKKPLDIMQNEALSEVSNYVMEKAFTTKECGKPNEIDVNASRKLDLTHTDNPLARFPSSSDIKPLVEADSTPAEFPAGEENIKGSSSNDPEKYKESSDEQESFGLQRKVKTIYQRAGNQASTESENDLMRPEQDSVATHEDSRKNPGASYEPQETPSEMSTKDSSLVELDLSPYGTQVEANENDIPIEETFTGMLCENQVLDDIEEPLKNKNQERKSNLNQSHKLIDQGCSLSPKISVVKERQCSLQADDQIDENTANKITQDNTNRPEDLKKYFLSNRMDIPTGDSQPATFRNPALPRHKRQHSDNGQERCLNLKDHPKLTNPPMLITANNSIPEKSPESIRKVRFEMGPPLPPLLNPLTVTPPRFRTQELKALPRIVHSKELSILSNEGTPIQENLMAPLMLPHSNMNSPCLSISSADDAKRRRVISSPLQFSTSTPKHAVPVPGRLPPSASNPSSSSPGASQENSVRILDTMYPELSARARTLNILRGSVNLNRCTPDTGTTAPDSVTQISRFKAVSSSRVFTKTEQSNEGEIRFKQSTENVASKDDSSSLVGQLGKKTGANVLLPKNAKKRDSPAPTMPHGSLVMEVSPEGSVGTREDGQAGNATATAQNPILDALIKIETSCFDLLPVIKSHVSVRRISTVPVLRDEEKEVIHEFAVVNKHLAVDLLSAILVKMKTEKNSLCGMYMQALCRVYTGICRQRADWERAHLFSYSILKEDFPDSAKLILFIVTTWHNVLSQTGVLCRALHAVLKLKAQEDVLHCLTSCLDWEKKPPCDSGTIIKSTLMAMRMGVNMKFLKHDRHGDDLNHAAWTYIYTLDLLCTQQQWKWTHDNIICKELWPIMNSWVTQPRDRQTPIRDISVATTLRLIGRLGQLGIKEKSFASVKNVAQVINTFVRHGKGEGVPWPVQLAAVYTIYDLSPSNPKEALDALAAWRGETLEAVPPAVTSCITQIGSVCRYI